MKFSVFQVSRIGGREINEDRMGYSYTSAAGLFLVADGMGGHPEGEVASQLALQVMSAMFQEVAQPELPDCGLFLANAVNAAHRRILRYASEKKMPDAPRTTIVAAIVQAGAVTWIHCGDSRLYLVRDGRLLARTKDHSMVEKRLSAGIGEKVPEFANRNILFTCLGSPSRPMFEVAGPVVLQQGDRLLLCSDGLWSSLSDAEIVCKLSGQPVSSAVPDMVDSALRVAGHSSDNVTAIALEWETPDASDLQRNRVSFDTVSENAFAATVRGGLPGYESESAEDQSSEPADAEGRGVTAPVTVKRV